MGGLCSTGVRPAPTEDATLADAESVKKPISSPDILGLYPVDYDPPFPVEIVGTFSNHGIEPEFGQNDTMVKVKANQDRGSVDFPFAGNVREALFCCLDGHGREGDKVSQFVMEIIHETVEADAIKLQADPVVALVDAFEYADEKLRRSDINSHSSGTSLVSVYMKDDHLWIANCGDSRAIIGRKEGGMYKAHDLSWDQKPDSQGEKTRIMSMGGVVTAPEAPGLSSRVWLPNGRYGLSMARSIGDHLLSVNGVIATPEVEKYQLVPDDHFLILATDGIWEFIDSQAAMDIVSKHTNASEACYDLIKTATRKWREEEGDYRDDITAIVIMIPQQQAHMAKHGQMDQLMADCISPTSKDLRKRRNVAFPDGTTPQNTEETSPPVSPVLPSAVAMSKEEKKEKAKTFRKRRLSTNPMDEHLIEEARKQHAKEKESLADAPFPKGKAMKRRLSISPDMDQTGSKLVPEGMA